jgi:hypothetical protein
VWQEAVINIFSVATGHLYERLLKIMILSVLKNTQSPVKFWFIKNYLSPGFKEFMPKVDTLIQRTLMLAFSIQARPEVLGAHSPCKMRRRKMPSLSSP